MVGWLVGWLVGSVGRSVGRLVGWLVGRLAGWLGGWLVGWLVKPVTEEVLAGTEIPGGGEEVDYTYRYTVTTRRTPALRCAAMKAILMCH